MESSKTHGQQQRDKRPAASQGAGKRPEAHPAANRQATSQKRAAGASAASSAPRQAPHGTGKIKIPPYSTQSFGRIEHPTMRKAPANHGSSPHATSSFRRPAERHDGSQAARPHAGANSHGQGSTRHQKTASQQRVSASAVPHHPAQAKVQVPRRPHPTVRRVRATPAQKLIPIAAAVVVVGVLALAVGYQFFWRSVDVTVNGRTYATPISATIQQLLDDNEYFQVKAGRLMSVGGNVIDEDGGERCTVTSDGAPVSADDLSTMKAIDAVDLTVANGADVTEEYTEETVAQAPGIQMDGSGAIQFVSQWGRAGKKLVWTGAQSGETVDHEVLEPAVDMVVSAYNARPQGSKKYIALTFDDGPSSYTKDILAILQRYGAKATFFNLGTQVDEDSKAVLDAGCELASHTNQHMNLPDCDRDTLRSEITSAFDAIEGAAEFRPQMMRAPYGAFTSAEWARAGDLISCNVLWNIDTLDWKLPGASAITDEVLSNAYNGAIVLMHDGGGNRAQDVEALPGIIEGLQAAGYELVTVSELMKTDGRFPEDVINGTVKMPEDADLPEV